MAFLVRERGADPEENFFQKLKVQPLAELDNEYVDCMKTSMCFMGWLRHQSSSSAACDTTSRLRKREESALFIVSSFVVVRQDKSQ